jgi:hypothetical protein
VFCRHCGHETAGRPRGLCWSCYFTPAIRSLYPSQARYGLARDNPGVPLPAAPTEARPGTEEKLAVLCERAAHHQSLWHPLDEGCRRRWLPPCAHVERPLLVG